MPRRCSIIQSLNFSAAELATLLIELHAEGETLPPGAFDELAEATLHLHPDASHSVLHSVDAKAKLSLGLALAHSIVDGTSRERRSRTGHSA